jgi:hypothetical protein
MMTYVLDLPWQAVAARKLLSFTLDILDHDYGIRIGKLLLVDVYFDESIINRCFRWSTNGGGSEMVTTV